MFVQRYHPGPFSRINSTCGLLLASFQHQSFHSTPTQVLAYVERLCTGAAGAQHAAMFVHRPDFFALLGNVVKTSKNVALRVQALHVGGLLLRHAPVISIAISESGFVTQAVEDVKQQQQVCAHCISLPTAQLSVASRHFLNHFSRLLLTGFQGGDPSQRRRAVAALSELVFYGAAQCMSQSDCISLPSGFLQVADWRGRCPRFIPHVPRSAFPAFSDRQKTLSSLCQSDLPP